MNMGMNLMPGSSIKSDLSERRSANSSFIWAACAGVVNTRHSNTKQDGSSGSFQMNDPSALRTF